MITKDWSVSRNTVANCLRSGASGVAGPFLLIITAKLKSWSLAMFVQSKKVPPSGVRKVWVWPKLS